MTTNGRDDVDGAPDVPGRPNTRAARRAERPCSAASSPRRTLSEDVTSEVSMPPSSTGGQHHPRRRRPGAWI